MTRAVFDDQTIARWRLANQRLTGQPHDSAPDVVADLLCVQAENHAQASWAVASRTTGLTQSEFAACFDRGDILRTHVLRPTWHFVAPADIGWLLELTRPRIWPSCKRLTAQFGLDQQQLTKSVDLIVAAIDSDGPQKRGALAQRLESASLPSEGLGLSLSFEYAEVEGLVCSGPMLDGEHSYALLDVRAPKTRRLDRATAIAELTLRYLSSHGPATAADLSYWSSLTLTDARSGISALADQLQSFDHDGRAYWHLTGATPLASTSDPRAHLLQILDECYRGYQDSRWVLDADGLVPRAREKATGMVLIDGQIVATMRRTIAASNIRFHLRPYRSLTRPELAAINAEADRYASFLEVTPEVIWVS